MIRTKTRLRLCTTLLIANLIFIWGNSLLPGEISGALSDWVKALLQPLFGGSSGGGSGGLLRKAAHFTEFACLGMCLCWLFGMLQKKFPRQLLYSLWAAFCAACIDETIQIFVPDRGPGIKDVGIDTLGSVFGIAIIALAHIIRKRKHTEVTKP